MPYKPVENPKKRGRKVGQTGPGWGFSEMLRQLKPGTHMYTDFETKFVTSIAVSVGCHVQTKICLLIEDYQTEPKTRRITKVSKL